MAFTCIITTPPVYSQPDFLHLTALISFLFCYYSPSIENQSHCEKDSMSVIWVFRRFFFFHYFTTYLAHISVVEVLVS